MAVAVDAHEAVPAPPMSQASVPSSMPPVSIEDAPTEPATSPRTDRSSSSNDGLKNFAFLPGSIGPQEEPERFAHQVHSQ